ncbi:glycosyltransferase [Saccharolobus sp.]|uniref:glycosyltransferase n=1 Tax=Saccharolobus sp. TaxID=2100761 RepID=UPI0031730DFB
MSNSTLNPKVSIVIATYNSERYLPYLFESLLSQEGVPLKEIEVIFVDGNSSDATIDLLYDFMHKYREVFYDVKVVVHDINYGVSKARNDGIRISEGEYVLILDSDVMLPHNGVYRLLDFMEKSGDPSLAGVKALHIFPESLSDKLTLDKIINCKHIGRVTEYYSIADATLLKKKVFEEVGLYREDMGPPFSSLEDWEIGMRLKRKGYKVVMLGDLIAIHKPVTSYKVPSTHSLRYFIKNRIREYFSQKKALEIIKVIEVMPAKDKFEIYFIILLINVALFIFAYGLFLLKSAFILAGILLFLAPYLLYALYSLIYFKGCKISHRLISSIFIITSRILRYLILESFYIYKNFEKLIRIIRSYFYLQNN